MILDVGCGAEKQGDIGVDITLNSPEIMQDGRILPTQADILASGDYLPFIDNCFTCVVSHHTIEHSTTPHKFFSELLRVSENAVYVRCPHVKGRQAYMPYHVSYFNEAWFHTACLLFNIPTYSLVIHNDTIDVFDEHRGMYVTHKRPREIGILMFKNGNKNGEVELDGIGINWHE